MKNECSACIVHFAWRTAEFYAHESCANAPCARYALDVQILERILQGKGRMEDIDLLAGDLRPD